MSWDYFLADLELEARATSLKVMRDFSVGSVCDAINALPPRGLRRMLAARFVYFTPPAPENEAQVDELLLPIEAETAKAMRKRRHAVHAAQAQVAERKAQHDRIRAANEELVSEWRRCPRAELSSEPNDFLQWIKFQTPDTWHVVVAGWDHNMDDRDAVIEWIFSQEQCDIATVAGYFFVSALGLAEEEPSELSPLSRRKWLLMQRIADNWSRGFYRRHELALETEPWDVKWYDERVAQRVAEGRPFPWRVPKPEERRFGTRSPQTDYCYEPGHLRLKFESWKRRRDDFGLCGQNFPHCCDARKVP